MNLYLRLLVGLPLVTLLFACASQPREFYSPAPLLGHQIPPIEEPNFHQISPEMVEFLDQFVTQNRGKTKAAWELVWAVTDPNIRTFIYDPGLTLPPVETFHRQSGNCLSYSAMLMMMARHLGLKASYQEVEIPQQWNSDNNTLLVSMHINVVIEGDREGSWIVDVSGRAESRSRLQRRIKDHSVLAQYYNNLGADALANEDLGKAYAYISKAIDTDPQLQYLWSNLGVVFSRNEQLEDATRAYLTALKIDPGSSMAANNLYLIYEKTGNIEAAQDLEKRVARNRKNNPYYLSHQSEEAFEEGRYADSQKLLEKALRIHDGEFRFHYQLARTLVVQGKKSAALASLQRAIELAPPDFPVSVAQLEQLPELP
jgi:tetratricopeptide (TPR) repeat protein